MCVCVDVYMFAINMPVQLRDVSFAFPVMQRVSELEKKNIAIQKAYILSCTNGRVSDFVSAAKVLRGHKVAPGTHFDLNVFLSGAVVFNHFSHPAGICISIALIVHRRGTLHWGRIIGRADRKQSAGRLAGTGLSGG